MKHILGFSGGIDSQAVYRWLRNRYAARDVIALNSQAGRWENNLTVDFVADYSRNIAPVIEVVPLVKDIWITDEWAESLGLDGNQELTMELRKVVEWARTSRGGRQQLFPILHEREGCESKYGLCE